MLNEELHGNVDSPDVWDSHNMSPNIPGKIGARVKIGGESLRHTTTDPNDEDYKCVASVSVRGKVIELWGGIEDGLIVVDGETVCRSENLPIRVSDMCEMIGNDNITGGEVYINNRRTAPFILSIKDMVDNVATDEYFDDFNVDRYTINLKSSLNILQFRELIALGGGAGVPIGAYTYSVRYATRSGDRTNWSVETPPVQVPVRSSISSDPYPGVKNFGGDANNGLLSGYGVKLKFRVVNEYNFDFIEIKRTPFNVGGGLAFTPNQEIVAKIDISYDQVSVIEFVDGRDNNVKIPISDSDLENQFTEISKANSIVYADRRLHCLGVEYASRDISDLELKASSISGNVIDPFLMNIGEIGHNDAYNAAYYRSQMRGEKRSFAIVGFDGLAGAGLAKKFDELKNYQMPNRRDELSNVTEFWSVTNGRGAATAMTVSNTLGLTHDVVNMATAVGKTNFEPVNIVTNGTGTTGMDPEEIGWKPLTPTSVNDSNVKHHGHKINRKVYDGSLERDYNPKGFAPDYISMGVMLAGVDKTTIPSWMKAFSVVQTPPAGRVVAQGIGIYLVSERGEWDSSVKKETNGFWFYSSDINNGAVSSLLVEDIKANPSRYKIQLVAPFGFFSEVYFGDYDADFLISNRDADIDMVSYARVSRSLNINPGETSYVGFGYWRNSDFGNDAYTSTDKVFGITSFNNVTEGRGEYFSLTVDGTIYSRAYCADKQFNDTTVKEWHEPFYIVNIIQEGASIPDNNIQQYVQTGHYQKLESLVAVSPGVVGYRVELVDERYEDCCVDAYSSTKSTDNVYLYVVGSDNVEKRWLDVTYKDTATRNAILADIQSFGSYNDGSYEIYGVYTHDVENDRFYTIVFDNFNTYFPDSLFIPEAGAKVFVKYDDRFPIKVFGGDAFLAESIFAPIDRDTTNGESDGFLMKVGMPYYKWYWDNDYLIPKNVTAGFLGDNIQNSDNIEIDYVRQWCVMFSAESRSPNHLNYGKCFPNIHYVMRPIKWSEEDLLSNFAVRDNGTLLDGKIREEYLTTYPDEHHIWGYGGLKFEEKVNSDYAAIPYRKYFSAPDFEFEEQTVFGTRDHYSNQRNVNQQFYPGLRSFPPFNIYDADDQTGQFNKGLYGESSDKGNNVYVMTERGTAILFLGKKTLSDASGATITYMASEGAVTGEYWLSKHIGCPGDLFKTAVSSGSDFFFCSPEGVQKITQNAMVNISGGYWPKIKAKLDLFNSSFTNTYAINAEYYRDRMEYWMTLEPNDGDQATKLQDPVVFVYCESPESPAKDKWVGSYGYQFDSFLYHNRGMIGFRQLDAYNLLTGNVMNSELFDCWVDVVFSKEIKEEKEFIRFAEGSRQKPSLIEFYIDTVKQCSVAEADIKDYGTFEQFIPRKDASVSATRDRLQHDYVIKRVISEERTDFEIVTSATQYKILK